MKKSRMLIVSSLAMLLGVGVFAGIKFAKGANPVEASATEYIDIYCTKSFDYLNDAISAHSDGGSTAGTTWPGTPMEKVFENENGESVFKTSIPNDRTVIVFVSWQGSDLKQTHDIKSNIKNNQGWYFSGWSDGKMTVGEWDVLPYTINYHGNESTSGSMASETGYSNVAWGLTANAFSRSNYTFSGWNTEPDGSGTSYDNLGLVPKNSTFTNDTLDLYAQWTRVYSSGRYIIGNFGDCNWGMDGSVQMTSSSDQYVATIDLEYGDSLKVVKWNGSTITEYIGYSTIVTTCGGYYCFSNSVSDDFVCQARGTYIFYYTDGNWGGKRVSIEIDGSSRTAEQLAAKLMSYGDPSMASDGQCGSRFSTCKTMYLDNLSGSEKTTFQEYGSFTSGQFKNAYDRYTTWAMVLGEKPWETGKLSSVIRLFGTSSENTGTTIIIIAITSICAVAIGGYFLFRKKKEN